MEKENGVESKKGQSKVKGTQSGPILKLLKTTEEDFLIEQLGEKSEDYLYLKELERTVKGVTWEKIIKYTRIENGKIEGIYWEDEIVFNGLDVKIIKKFKLIRILHIKDSEIEDLGEIEEVSMIHVEGSKLKSIGKIKKITQMFRGENSLIELQLDVIEKIEKGELEMNHGDFGGTVEGVEKLIEKKRIPGNLRLGEVEIESLGKIEEIKGYVDLPIGCKSLGNLRKVRLNMSIENTNIDLQLQVIKRVNARILIVGGDLSFGGNIEGLERFLEVDYIPGDIDITNMRLEDKLKFIDKRNKGKLKIEGIQPLPEREGKMYITGEPGSLPSSMNGYFPRIGLDTNLEDESMKFWVKSLSFERDDGYDGEEENYLVDDWIGKKMWKYYQKSVEEYKGEDKEELIKEKEKFFRKMFPNLFEDSIISMERYKNR